MRHQLVVNLADPLQFYNDEVKILATNYIGGVPTSHGVYTKAHQSTLRTIQDPRLYLPANHIVLGLNH